MDAREKRLAQNESLFRSVNERIEQTAVAAGVDDHTFEFLCECSNADCNLLLPLTIPEYESIRKDPTLFLVAPGHELPEIETVLADKGAYQIVTKRGEAAEYVTERDPRGGGNTRRRRAGPSRARWRRGRRGASRAAGGP